MNDTWGHQAGDQVLRQVAQRLTSSVRTTDTAARLGGDEFAFLLPAADGPRALLAAERVLAALRAPLEIEGRVTSIGASIGIALFPEHGDDLDALLRYADQAMYDAKRGREGVKLFEPPDGVESSL